MKGSMWPMEIPRTRYSTSSMRSVAETGRVPPASGEIVRAIELPAGFLTVRIEFTEVVWTKAVAVICDVPVARPTTVYASSAPSRVRINWPASVTGTWNETR